MAIKELVKDVVQPLSGGLGTPPFCAKSIPLHKLKNMFYRVNNEVNYYRQQEISTKFDYIFFLCS